MPSRCVRPYAYAAAARALDVEFGVDAAGEERILLDGDDVSFEIRTEAAGAEASRVAAMPPVRAALLERQRAFARPPGLVADGRDMGTVVFPVAPLKIYLTASPEERARRRHNQLKEKGLTVTIDDLSQEIRERDLRDSSRPVAPLRPAADAILLDSTGLAIEQVVDQVLELARSRLPALNSRRRVRACGAVPFAVGIRQDAGCRVINPTLRGHEASEAPVRNGPLRRA